MTRHNRHEIFPCRRLLIFLVNFSAPPSPQKTSDDPPAQVGGMDGGTYVYYLAAILSRTICCRVQFIPTNIANNCRRYQ